MDNIQTYLKTITRQLVSEADQIRELIGETNWLADGEHKEILIIKLLQKHLPNGYVIRKGFILPRENSSREASREQDILIIDIRSNNSLFDNGGIAIVDPDQVVAAISVKSGMTSATIKDSIDTLRTARESSFDPSSKELFCGAFFFHNPDKTFDYRKSISKQMRKSAFLPRGSLHKNFNNGPNLFATPRNICIYNNFENTENDSETSSLISLATNKCAATIFIASILRSISMWEDKEVTRSVGRVLDIAHDLSKS